MMQTALKETVSPFEFYDYQPSTCAYQSEVIEGLSRRQKRLPCALLYDKRGANLFEEICKQEEYYVTRTEMAILRKYAHEITSFLGKNPLIFEFGSGDTQKIRALLDTLGEGSSYIAIDIARDQLLKNAAELATEYPQVRVIAVCADFNKETQFLRDLEHGQTKVFFFPGSTIGNLPPEKAQRLLQRVSTIVGGEGAALIGVDLKKDPEILHRAYNDRSGITSQFELNVLQRLNTELGADFDLDAFRYVGTYNRALGRVEMYLESTCRQQVHIDGHAFRFRKSERIHIEDSYKYSVDAFHILAQNAGFRTTITWMDPKNWFSINLLLH